MRTIEARVTHGRLVVDEATALPEGTELDLVAADADDDLDDVEREALHVALRAAWSSAQRGETRPAEELIERLRRAP